MGALGLLAFLIFFQQAIQQGLLTGFVGAIRTQSAPVLVYTVDGQRVLQASSISPELEEIVIHTDGVAQIGPIGQSTFTAIAAQEMVDVTLIGFADPAIGGPSRVDAGRMSEAPGEAVVSHAGVAGFEIGDTIEIEPGGLSIEIVGEVADAQLSVSPTLFVPYDTFVEATAGRGGEGQTRPNVLGVIPADGVSAAAVTEAINAQDDRLDAMTKNQAADETPGVAQVRQSFQLIFALFGMVVPLVTGLFFLIVTVQKAGALTLLRAVGVPQRRLIGSLLIQVAIIVGGGIMIGIALFAPLAAANPTSVSIQFDTGVILRWTALLAVLGTLSSLAAARRVLALDPVAAATGGGGLR